MALDAPTRTFDFPHVMGQLWEASLGAVLNGFQRRPIDMRSSSASMRWLPGFPAGGRDRSCAHDPPFWHYERRTGRAARLRPSGEAVTGRSVLGPALMVLMEANRRKFSRKASSGRISPDRADHVRSGSAESGTNFETRFSAHRLSCGGGDGTVLAKGELDRLRSSRSNLKFD
jgi:hypothetical protein